MINDKLEFKKLLYLPKMFNLSVVFLNIGISFIGVHNMLSVFLNVSYHKYVIIW